MAALDPWLPALHRSHRRLADVVTPLSDEEVSGQSYDDEWSIAQVLSHLGSGAEIFGLFISAGLDGTPVPGPEAFGPIWERWNAKSPSDQSADALTADRAFLDRLDALDDAQGRAWHLDMFGIDRDLVTVLQMRLGEHVLHTWDVAVTVDHDDTLPVDAVDLLIDVVDQMVERVAKPPAEPVRLRVTTHQPDRQFVLTLGDSGGQLADLDASDTSSEGPKLDLPAESLIRLVYGRLDPDHTPGSVTAEGIELDILRRVFPGF